MKRVRYRAIWASALAIAVFGGVALSIFAIQSSGQVPAAPPVEGAVKTFEALEVPLAAPEVAFADGEGRELTLARFRGSVVLLNVWATWCGPCVREMPSLDRLQARLGSSDFQVVALSLDRGGTEVVRRFYDKHGLANLGIYLDRKGALARALGVRGLPTSVMIDRAGRVVGRIQGAAEWDSPEALALIRFYL